VVYVELRRDPGETFENLRKLLRKRSLYCSSVTVLICATFFAPCFTNHYYLILYATVMVNKDEI